MKNYFEIKSVDEVRKMTLEEFGKYLMAWNDAIDKHLKPNVLNESEKCTFSSFEEAQKYYGGISFEEFEQKYFK